MTKETKKVITDELKELEALIELLQVKRNEIEDIEVLAMECVKEVSRLIKKVK
jgi:hypothetical protein